VRAITALFAILAIALPSQAWAEAKWVYVADARNGNEKYIVQVDQESITRNGSIVRYWLRLVDADSITISEGPSLFKVTVSQGPSLYQDNCVSHQLRIIQGRIIWGYEGPSIPLSRPAEWQYIVPDSLAEKVHGFVCAN
jgi:hypothetical protein